MADFYIRQGDTQPSVTGVVRQPDKTPSNIQGGSTAKFRMRKFSGGAWTIDAPATIVDAANGKVRYDWQAGDTGTPGEYEFEFVLLTPAGQFTVPNTDPRPRLTIGAA